MRNASTQLSKKGGTNGRSWATIFLTLMILFMASGTALAIPKAEKKQLKKARKHLAMGEYTDAKAAYEELLKMNSDNSEYWFETGLAYYNSQVDKEKSVKYFERAHTFQRKLDDGTMVTDSIGEVMYYLGRAYQYMGRFDEAIKEYEMFNEFVLGNNQGGVLARDVDRFINQCNNGIKLSKNKNEEVSIENLGQRVNTEWSEYAPVINKDQTIIVFTARRDDNTGTRNYHDNRKYEDIWVSVVEGDEWSNATQLDSSNNYISSKINSKFHDAAVAYNYDETILYIYRRNDVWQSVQKDGKWGEPVRLNNNVNTQGHEPSVFLSPDGNTLFVVSNRKGGFGGRDIYVSKKKKDGTWGEVENLGPKINTPYDEDAPFLSKDGETLYFSSNGSQSIGGYDVFRATKDENGNWSNPENLGVPINTAGDDIYYVQLKEQNVAYISSSRPYGYGHMDIYRVELECKPIPNTEIRGLLVEGENLNPVGGNILITDNETGEDVGRFDVDPTTGKYLLVLPPGKSYHFKVEAGDYLPHNADIFVPKQCDYYQLYQEIQVKYIMDTAYEMFYPQKAVFNNAFFDVEDETKKFYGIEEDIETVVGNDVPVDQQMNLVATVHHNPEQPGIEVGAWLLNENNNVVQTSRTTEDGTVKFIGLDPNKKYKILFDEETLKASDPDNAAATNALGDVFYEKIGGEPAKNMPVMIVTKNKVVQTATTTDAAGHWQLTTAPNSHPLVTEMQGNPLKYEIKANDEDQLYSAYIKVIDTANTDLYYSEIIDEITIEEIPPLLLELGIDTTKKYGLPEFEDLLFDFDRYFLRERSKEILDEVLAFMKEHPEVNLNIAGHTDWKGSEEYNQKLSKRRTRAAYNYLVKNGIDRRRLTQEWFGETYPVAANANPDGSDNPDGRQLNRRVELRLVAPETSFIFYY